MNDFLRQYIEKLTEVENLDHVRNLYMWFWNNQADIEETVGAINQPLGLDGEYELKPDLPCLAVGGLGGVLILSANPGWGADLNAIEEQYCRLSEAEEKYLDLMLNYFEAHPRVLQRRIRWWNNAISWADLLLNKEKCTGEEKWRRAQESRDVGGWELFPFHSSKDGLSARITDHDHFWLKDCALKSRGIYPP